MSLRQFGFKKDDESFLRDTFDPSTRRSLMIQLSGIRNRTTIGFYFMFTGGVLYGFIGLVSAKPPLLGMGIVLFLTMMFLAFSLHADAKYKLVSVVERLEQAGSGSSPDIKLREDDAMGSLHDIKPTES